MRRRVALTLGLVAALLVPAAGFVAASDTPTPVCGTCGDQFESHADVNVTRSTVDVHLHENGSAHWTTRTTLTDESARDLRNRPNTTAVVADAAEYNSLGTPTNVSAAFEGDTLVVSSRLPDVATRSVGVLVVHGLERVGATTYVNAEHLTIHPPAGYDLTRTPESPAIRNESLVWHGSTHGQLYDNPTIGGAFAAYAPVGADYANARTTLAIAAVQLPVVLDQFGALAHYLFPLSLLVLGGYVAASRRVTAGRDPGSVAETAAGYAGVLFVLGAGAGVVTGQFAPVALPAGGAAGVVTTTLLAGKYETGVDRALAAGAAVVVTAVALTAIATWDKTTAVKAAVSLTLLAVHPLAFYALGHADGVASPRRQWAARTAVVLLPLAAILPTLPYEGFGGFAILLAFGASTVGVAICSAPIYYAGYTLGAHDSGEP